MAGDVLQFQPPALGDVKPHPIVLGEPWPDEAEARIDKLLGQLRTAWNDADLRRQVIRNFMQHEQAAGFEQAEAGHSHRTIAHLRQAQMNMVSAAQVLGKLLEQMPETEQAPGPLPEAS